MSGIGITAWGFFAALCVAVLAVVIALAYFQGYEARRADERREREEASEAR